MVDVGDTKEPTWLLLIHQIPPQPSYFRAKVGRRLQRLGAVAIKNTVYALPRTDQTQEDLQWVAREIVAEGGEATLCRAVLVEGLKDEQVVALFHSARDAEYAQLTEEAMRLSRAIPAKASKAEEVAPALGEELARLKRRLTETIAIDHFGAPARNAAEQAVAAVERRLEERGTKPATTRESLRKEDFVARTWITRKGVHVDRIGSAWLIRRFIDPRAKFKFVAPQGYRPKAKELRFDMFDAEFTHEGDLCTFEVLVDRFEVRIPGLAALAEIVHDIDVKDGKFGRADAAGVGSVIAGVSLLSRDDDERLERGFAVFDALLETHRRKRG